MNIRQVIDPLNETETVSNIACAYRQAFGHTPWNEGYRCPCCNAHYPLTYIPQGCRNCEYRGQLEEYWPHHQVKQDFEVEMKKTGATCFVAEEVSEVVGFAWGYALSMCKKTSAYLHAPNLHTVIEGEIFYLDEIAVIPPYQGKKIGRELMRRIITQKYPTSILRTLEDSPMQRLALSLGWQTVMRISKSRIIMSVNC